MDNVYPLGAWRRLGELLEQRRAQLGYGFRQRGQFLRDRGGPPPSLKTLGRIERGERAFYPASTVALLERLYGFEPGSFEAVLRGGDPVPRPVSVGAGASPAEDDAGRARVIDGVRALYPGDPVAEAIMSQWHKPLETRQSELDEWRRVSGRGTAREHRALQAYRNKSVTIGHSP